jgi:hypothetical protein
LSPKSRHSVTAFIRALRAEVAALHHNQQSILASRLGDKD